MVVNQIMNAVNGMSGNSGSDIQTGTRQPKYRGRQGYPRTLEASDFFDDSGTVSVSTGKYERIGAWEVGARQYAEVGQGDPSLDPAEQGRPLIELKDDADAATTYAARLLHESAQDTETYKVVQDTGEAFKASNRSDRIVLSRASVSGYPRVGEDSRIVLEATFSDNGSGTISEANSSVRVPVTIYE